MTFYPISPFFPGLITAGRRRPFPRLASRPVAYALQRRTGGNERRLNENLLSSGRVGPPFWSHTTLLNISVRRASLFVSD